VFGRYCPHQTGRAGVRRRNSIVVRLTNNMKAPSQRLVRSSYQPHLRLRETPFACKVSFFGFEPQLFNQTGLP
jgi:hypothetical protein